eukprot:1147085-Pelagomonas_calceolata.AAC.2
MAGDVNIFLTPLEEEAEEDESEEGDADGRPKGVQGSSAPAGTAGHLKQQQHQQYGQHDNQDVSQSSHNVRDSSTSLQASIAEVEVMVAGGRQTLKCLQRRLFGVALMLAIIYTGTQAQNKNEGLAYAEGKHNTTQQESMSKTMFWGVWIWVGKRLSEHQDAGA